MSYRKTALGVAKSYMETHPDDDREFVRLVCLNAAECYDTSGSRLSLEAYITLQMRTAMLVAKQNAIQLKEDDEMAYQRTSDKEKDEILAELKRGDDPKDVAIRHNVKNGTLYAMMNRWRELGLLPPKEEKKTSVQDAIAACEPKPRVAAEKIVEPTAPKPEAVEVTQTVQSKVEAVPLQPKQEAPIEKVPLLRAPFKICTYINQTLEGSELVAAVTNNETGFVQAKYKNKDGEKFTVTIMKE